MVRGLTRKCAVPPMFSEQGERLSSTLAHARGLRRVQQQWRPLEARGICLACLGGNADGTLELVRTGLAQGSRGRVTRYFVLLGIALGLLMGVGGYTFIYARGASYMTDDPAACANCHVMNEQ